MKRQSRIQADFDRIAPLSRETWNHNRHYHDFLLKHVPSHCEEALEVGCGTGAFTRLLAQRSDRVLALDLSPAMIRMAQERSSLYPNIEYRVADATAWEFPVERFDCIACIATLHHLPIEEMLLKMKGALRIGGTLVLLGLFEASGPSDVLIAVAAVPVNLVLTLIKNGRLREPREVREAWAEHGRNDTYPRLTHMREICADILPGAEVRRHLLWRYSITWKRGIGDRIWKS
jgi:ubiquinone/menaquinone biosynthesis C-methylase UbiE